MNGTSYGEIAKKATKSLMVVSPPPFGPVTKGQFIAATCLRGLFRKVIAIPGNDITVVGVVFGNAYMAVL